MIGLGGVGHGLGGFGVGVRPGPQREANPNYEPHPARLEEGLGQT